MASNTTPLHLGVGLAGLGTHPRAWKLAPVQARSAFGADHHLRLAALAQDAALDLLYFDDSYRLQSDDDRDVRGRLDAALLASRLAPVTSGIGLVPAFTVTHAEPFHVSKAVATLDFTSEGRAGWSIEVASSADPTAEEQTRHFGRRSVLGPDQAYAEAADVADVVQRLFDSWEDDAEIRDLPTGRFIDRDKLHYVDFVGEFFSVKGPSITPRPPQGQPLTVVPVRRPEAVALAGRYADLAIVSAPDLATAGELADQVRRAAAGHGRADQLTVLAEYDVLLAADHDQLGEQQALLSADLQTPPAPRGVPFTGTPAELTDQLAGLATSAWFDGALINFAVLPLGLPLFVDAVVPQLVAQGLFRERYAEATLRERFGLTRPANRYAVAG